MDLWKSALSHSDPTRFPLSNTGSCETPNRFMVAIASRTVDVISTVRSSGSLRRFDSRMSPTRALLPRNWFCLIHSSEYIFER